MIAMPMRPGHARGRGALSASRSRGVRSCWLLYCCRPPFERPHRMRWIGAWPPPGRRSQRRRAAPEDEEQFTRGRRTPPPSSRAEPAVVHVDLREDGQLGVVGLRPVSAWREGRVVRMSETAGQRSTRHREGPDAQCMACRCRLNHRLAGRARRGATQGPTRGRRARRGASTRTA